MLLLACSTSTPKAPPSELLNHDVMQVILMDIHLMEAYVGEMKLPEDSLQDMLPTYYQEIFERHGTSKDAFFTSFHYYVENPDFLQSVYEAILDSLKMLQIDRLR